MPSTLTAPIAPSLNGLLVRDVQASDRDAFAAMFGRLSPQSRLRRYLSPKPGLTGAELRYLTDVDHVRHSAIAAFDAAGRMTGVARYAMYPGEEGVAEVAVEVVDAWQQRGIGTLLTERVIARASANGLTLLRGTTMWENVPARTLLRRLDFTVCDSAGGLLDFERRLGPAT